jgi:sugar/nucleoside kinase (ribokinase family)
MPAVRDLLILAEVNPDVVVACGSGEVRFGQVEQPVSGAALTLGSSGAITAAAAVKLGARVSLCGVVGDDPGGRLCLELLEGFGVDVAPVRLRADRATGMTVVLTRPDGDRALLTFGGTMADLRIEDVPDLDARHVHVSSFYLQRALQAGLPDALAAARANGATTSLDPGWDPAEEWAGIEPCLRHLDYLLPNAQEVIRIASAAGETAATPQQAAVALAGRGCTVVVKLGAEGALAASPDGLLAVRGKPVDPVDTTGAGDNFDAGFLTAVIEGASLQDALARGAACGAISVGGVGGTGRLASRDEALALAGRLRTGRVPSSGTEQRA